MLQYHQIRNPGIHYQGSLYVIAWFLYLNYGFVFVKESNELPPSFLNDTPVNDEHMNKEELSNG